MRVLWLSSSFPPQIGGLPEYCDLVTRHLATRVELTVVSAQGQCPSAVARHVECPYLGGFSAPDARDALERSVRAIYERTKPHVVHFGHAQMAALRNAFPASARIVCTVHGNDLTWPWMRFGEADIGAAVRDGLRNSDVICVSEHAAALVRGCGIEARVSIVHNACDLERFRPIDFDRAAFRQRLGVREAVPILLTVGRLAARKSQMTIMRALSRLDLPFHWIVIGDGRERRKLDLARFLFGLRRNVTLLGRTDSDTVVRAYNTADLFVLTPTERHLADGIDSEGFGVVYHEAAACAVPSIASDASGCREAVLDGVTGLLVQPRDPLRLRAAIRTLLVDEPLRRRLGAAAQAHVRTQGGWEGVASRLVAHYRDIVSNGSSELEQQIAAHA